MDGDNDTALNPNICWQVLKNRSEMQR